MATNFPGSLDDFTNPTTNDKTTVLSHAEQHTDENDAIEAVEAKVGVDASAVTASLDYKVSNTASVDPGHKHTPTVSLVITGTPDGTKFLRDDNTWSTPPTAADATNTTAGLVELGTAAEIDAGTATGSDGPLTVTPDQLALSKFSSQLPTSDEKDALAGTGTPSSASKYVTNDDTSGTGAVVRSSLLPGATEIQTFTSSGTWTKTAGAIKVLVQSWGGGGSGANASGTAGAGGAGSGEYNETWLDADDTGATETVTIGAGGALVSSDSTNGNGGGSTTFGSFATASGGGGGVQNSPPNDGTGGSGGSPFGIVDKIWSAGGVEAVGKSGTHSAGGGGGINASNTFVGGNSIFGGGGGGGSSSTGGAAGGTSTHGGNGGAGAFNGNATAGVVPGGGGGGNSGTGDSGAGGDGQVVITTFF